MFTFSCSHDSRQAELVISSEGEEWAWVQLGVKVELLYCVELQPAPDRTSWICACDFVACVRPIRPGMGFRIQTALPTPRTASILPSCPPLPPAVLASQAGTNASSPGTVPDNK